MQNSPLDNRELKDLQVLVTFTGVYCRCHHAADKSPLRSESGELEKLHLERVELCSDCREFLAYAIERRMRCPLEPKPTCKHCHIHCYRAGHREKVREIMKFSGPYLIKRGRLDLLWHYLF
jgi:Nitrous oxide-stimulated promoter